MLLPGSIDGCRRCGATLRADRQCGHRASVRRVNIEPQVDSTVTLSGINPSSPRPPQRSIERSSGPCVNAARSIHASTACTGHNRDRGGNEEGPLGIAAIAIAVRQMDRFPLRERSLRGRLSVEPVRHHGIRARSRAAEARGPALPGAPRGAIAARQRGEQCLAQCSNYRRKLIELERRRAHFRPPVHGTDAAQGLPDQRAAGRVMKAVLGVSARQSDSATAPPSDGAGC